MFTCPWADILKFLQISGKSIRRISVKRKLLIVFAGPSLLMIFVIYSIGKKQQTSSQKTVRRCYTIISTTCWIWSTNSPNCPLTTNSMDLSWTTLWSSIPQRRNSPGRSSTVATRLFSTRQVISLGYSFSIWPDRVTLTTSWIRLSTSTSTWTSERCANTSPLLTRCYNRLWWCSKRWVMCPNGTSFGSTSLPVRRWCRPFPLNLIVGFAVDSWPISRKHCCSIAGIYFIWTAQSAKMRMTTAHNAYTRTLLVHWWMILSST